MSYITEPSRPVLAARLKTATTTQRQQLAESILDADPGNSNPSNADDMIEYAKALAEHRQGTAPPTMPQLPKFLLANLALDSDPSVPFAAEDVLFRADVALLDRAQRAASTRVVTPPPEPALVAKRATDPDPIIRARAALAAAAALLGILRQPDAPSLSDRTSGRNLPLLSKLLDDPDVQVRRAAVIALVKYVRIDEPDALPMQTLLKLLAKQTPLHADARTSVLAIIPWLPKPHISNLANHADAEIKTAALLGLEQPPGNPNLKTRVPLPSAIAALSSPARRIRRMAAYSLLTPDPASATRAPQGARAILAATND